MTGLGSNLPIEHSFGHRLNCLILHGPWANGGLAQSKIAGIVVHLLLRRCKEFWPPWLNLSTIKGVSNFRESFHRSTPASGFRRDASGDYACSIAGYSADLLVT